MKYVLDSSAILAAVFGEPGADIVFERLRGGGQVSAVNFAEIISKLHERRFPDLDVIAEQFAPIVQTFDHSMARETGDLRTITLGTGISLGDRACIALARAQNATAVTADRSWADINLGVKVELIR